VQGVLLGKKIRNFDRLCCLEAPSLQSRRLSQHFWRYISSNRSNLGAALEVNISGARVSKISLVGSFCARLVGVRQSAKSIFETKSLWLAAKDSLIRKRWCYIYLFCPSFLRRVLECVYVFWGLVLIGEYKRVITEQQPELIITSHLSYLPFVALAEAAVSLGVPVFHPGDCIDRLAVGSSEVFHGFASILQYQDRLDDLQRVGVSQDLFFDPKSLYATEKKVRSSGHDSLEDRPSQWKGTGIVIYTHCLKDANNIFSYSGKLFENYFDWLRETILLLTIRTSSHDLIVYKIHPHSPRYEDLTPLRVMGWILRHGRNRRRVVIVDYDETMDSVLENYRDINLVSLSCNGSVFLEMARLGKKCISLGSPACPESGYYSPRSADEYKYLLLDKKKVDDIPSMTAEEQKECRDFALLMSYARLPDDFTHKWGAGLRDYYYFGKFSSCPDWGTLYQFREAIDNEIDTLFFEDDISGGIQFYFDTSKNETRAQSNNTDLEVV